VTIAGLQLKLLAKPGNKQRALLFITRVLALVLISFGIWGLFDWASRRDARLELSGFTTPEPQAAEVFAQWLEPDRVDREGDVWFAAIGDYGAGSAEEEEVALIVASWEPDFVVTAGDNRYGATTFDQVIGAYYCDFLQGAGVADHCPGGTAELNAFFPSPGNHDYSDGAGIEEYLNYFALPGEGVSSSHSSGSERYYDVVKGPVHFFFVDSLGALTSSTDNAAQQSWLKSQMETSPVPWQIVVMHHPPYSSGSHGSQTTMQWPYAAWGADFVLAGHDHTYERIAADGITYFVNGLGGRSIYGFGAPVPGSQVRYNGDYGAMLVQASQGQITFHFINRSGEVVDTALYQGSTPPPGDVKPRIYVPICRTIRQAN
jgi:hypothetical protein